MGSIQALSLYLFRGFKMPELCLQEKISLQEQIERDYQDCLKMLEELKQEINQNA